MRLIGLALVLAVSLILAPVCADAQQRTNLPRIMVFSLSSPPDHVRAFEEGLRALGYTPGPPPPASCRCSFGSVTVSSMRPGNGRS